MLSRDDFHVFQYRSVQIWSDWYFQRVYKSRRQKRMDSNFLHKRPIHFYEGSRSTQTFQNVINISFKDTDVSRVIPSQRIIQSPFQLNKLLGRDSCATLAILILDFSML